MAYSPLAIANAFVARAKEEGVRISNMKLQKLLYFAQGHSHAMRGERLIDEDPQAWDYGPVYPAVYTAFRRFGSGNISALAEDNSDPANWFNDDPDYVPSTVATPEDEQVNKFLDAVWDAYKGKSAILLSEMSHVAGGPWAKARERASRNSVIHDEDISEYFKAARKAALAKKTQASA
jgi:uncharacterized phage-associated protein